MHSASVLLLRRYFCPVHFLTLCIVKSKLRHTAHVFLSFPSFHKHYKLALISHTHTYTTHTNHIHIHIHIRINTTSAHSSYTLAGSLAQILCTLHIDTSNANAHTSIPCHAIQYQYGEFTVMMKSI